MTLFIKPHIQSLHAFTGMFRNRPLLTYDIAMWFCSNGMATSFNRDMDFWFATFCLNTPTIISNSFPGVKDGIYDETKCVIQQNANRWTDMWGKRNAYHIWNIRSSKIVAVPSTSHTTLELTTHVSQKSGTWTTHPQMATSFQEIARELLTVSVCSFYEWWKITIRTRSSGVSAMEKEFNM